MKAGILLGSVTLVALLGTVDAVAREPQEMGQNATGLCNAMAPATEASLRKFPLGLKNVGTVSNPIACSLAGDQLLPGNTSVYVWLRNESAPTEVTVNCIMVDGDTAITGSVSYPKSITLAVGELAPNTWLASDYGLVHFRKRSNLNCTLPPGVSMTLVGWNI
jgi:hypothetical protein